jgi:hypothetical protein
MTVGQVARTAQKSEGAIVYAARVGKLPVALRLPTGERLFDPRDVEQFVGQRATR